MISISDLLTLIVGAMVSFVSIGQSISSSLPLQAANNPAAVHREIVFIVVEASGTIAVIVFTLAGMTVEVVVVAIGAIVLAAIHVLTSTFLTALFVFSKNLLELIEFVLDSLELIEFRLSAMNKLKNDKAFIYILY